ncbi:PepSY domain-containing protein [Kordiimonas sp. SCSIO 12603]|uniref:PepSY-associated TM helix domain-containing protein n=1 Tax=Kordiimonas sp. SCSIO 12603 TaxID=2829596 RepID=UPI0021062FC1|nr:PepSY-associated TM helix domain-containing protein [Kordiimonas sp. SCSIO 12603]UTW60166.1 PepSY domain-containing protein [Kordiimonas sp. SCSIO 12603]
MSADKNKQLQAKADKQAGRKLMYEGHAWAGIGLGLLMFIVCFSGVVALFTDEVGLWEDERLRRAYSGPEFSLDKTVKAADAMFEGDADFVVAVPPNEFYPLARIFLRDVDTGHSQNFNFDPETNEMLHTSDDGVGHFLAHMHTDLHLPKPWGRYLVGFMGVVLMFSIITGVIIHKKILKELFSFRVGRSLRLMLTDSHKAMSVWGLIFHAMIGFTGALIGLSGILLLIAAGAAYKGDTAAAQAAILGTPPQYVGEAAPMTNLDELHAKAIEMQPGTAMETAIIQNFGDKNAYIEFNLDIPNVTRTALAPRGSVSFHAVTGEFLSSKDWHASGIGMRFYYSIVPLHYATYGGVALKVLYALLGISTSMLSISGILLWMERRTGRKGNEAMNSYRWLSALSVGVCGGMVLATASAFLAQHMAVAAGYSVTETIVGNTYFSVWVLSIIFAFGLGNAYRSTKLLLQASAAVSILVPVANGVLTGDHLFKTLLAGEWAVALVDLTMLGASALLIYSASKIPLKRPEMIRHRKVAAQPAE